MSSSRSWPRRSQDARRSSRSRGSRCSRLVGYRTPTIQRIRLGAGARWPADGDRARCGRADRGLYEITEPAAVPTRMMYAAAQSPHHPPAGAARPASELLDARARGVSRGCSRSSRRWTSWRWPVASIRSSCASATSRRSILKPATPSAVAASWRCLREGARALRLGSHATHDGASEPRWPLAHRDRRGRLDLSGPPVACAGLGAR